MRDACHRIAGSQFLSGQRRRRATTRLLFRNPRARSAHRQTCTKQRCSVAISGTDSGTTGSMAVMHENLTTCLRSAKPMSECHNEMNMNCENTMGAEACPMMGMKSRAGRADDPKKSKK